MNSKKVLSMLLVSLGAFSLALAGCNNKKNSDSSTAGTDSSKPSNSASGSGQSSPSTGTDSSTPSTGTDSSTPSTDEKPEATLYDVMFNYDDPKTSLTVWTDFDVSQSVAPYNVDSGRFYSEQNPDRRTVPLAYGQLCGMWYIAVDASGYIVYASYGTGAGYGSPSDDFYYNVSSKPVTDDAEFWSLHEQFATYGENNSKVTLDSQYVHLDTDGKQATTIDNFGAFDLLVPENGFIIKGHGEQSTFVDLCRQLRPDHITDAMSKIAPADVTQNGGNGDNFLGTTAPKSFDKFYLSIVEGENGSRKLSVRERTDDEKVDDTGWQEEETYAQAFTPTEADAPVVYATVEDVNGLTDAAAVEKLKGVVSYSDGNTVIIVDEDHKSVLITDETATKDYVVGDTVVVNGTKATTNGYLTVNATSVSKINGYGQLRPEAVTTVETVSDAKNVWKAENNYKVIKVVGAKVVSIDANGTSTIKLVDEKADDAEKEFTMNLYKATFPDTVAVGDTIDVTCAIVCNDATVQAITITDDISRYYNIEVDVDGDEGELEFEKEGHAKGDKVTLTPESPNQDYEFSHWVKWNPDTEEWEEASKDVDFEVEVGDEDAKYKAVFDYAAWKKLPAYMGEAFTHEALSTQATSDKDDTLFTVITDPEVGFSGTWLTPYDVKYNTIIAVDSEGKIAYFVYNPANGYGGPSGTGWYAHPDYASLDYHDNPAFTFLEGYGPWVPQGTAHTKFEVHAPEGGFLITTFNEAYDEVKCPNPKTPALDFVKAITNGAITEMSDNTIASINKRDLPVSTETRVFYDKANKTVKVYVPSLLDEHYTVTLNESCLSSKTGITVYTDDDRNPNVSKYDFAEGRHIVHAETSGMDVISVNSEGHIIYAGSLLYGGYASPADSFYSGLKEGNPIITKSSSANKNGIVGDVFALGPNYASWNEWNAHKGEADAATKYAYSDYELLVPEGGFVLTGTRTNNKAMQLLWGQVFGRDLQDKLNDGFNSAKPAGTFDNVVIKLDVENGVAQVKVEVATAEWVDPTLPSQEELLSMEGYEIAPYGTDDTDFYSNMTPSASKIDVTASKTPNVAYLLDTSGISYKTTISSASGGYAINVSGWDLVATNYYMIQEWTVEETSYKSIAYHGAGTETMYNNDNLAPQVGTAFNVKVGTADNAATWDGLKGAWSVVVSITGYPGVAFYYTESDTEKLLWRDNATFSDKFKVDGAGESWDNARFYWEYADESTKTEKKVWFHSGGISVTLTFLYNPTTNTVSAY